MMNTFGDQKLSTEMQELYLQNRNWHSDVLNLEDETRFLRKIIQQVLSSVSNEDSSEEIKFIYVSLNELEERRNKLKSLIIRQQHLLESALEDHTNHLGFGVIAEIGKIINEIKSIFISDKLIKKELFTLVEEVIGKDKLVLC